VTWDEIQSVATNLSATNKRERRSQLKVVLNYFNACGGGKKALLTIADTSVNVSEIWGGITDPAYLAWWLRAVWSHRGTSHYLLLNAIVRANDSHTPSANCKAARARFQLWREQSCDAIRRTFPWTGVPY
jgi:hypothetical protein